MSVRRRIAGAIAGLAALSLLPLSGAPAQASSAGAAYVYPTVTNVGHAFPAPPATMKPSTEHVRVRITWQVTQGQVGICQYRVLRFRDGLTDQTFYTTAKFIEHDLLEWYGWEYTVTPIDCKGIAGNPGYSNFFTPTSYPETEVQRFGPNWSYKTPTGAIGNQVAVTTTKGSSFSINVCYTNFAWIAQKNPQGGTASVKVDGVHLATVDLYSATVKHRQLVAKTFDAGDGCHTVTVTNTSTTARNQLNVDEIFIQSE